MFVMMKINIYICFINMLLSFIWNYLILIDVDDEGDDDEEEWEDGVDQTLIDRRSTYEPSAREIDENRRYEQMIRFVLMKRFLHCYKT